MKILSMTATFGKLAHETITLQPGLNIIEAPNEWGKSTWCAFLVSMLYGIDTRERTTGTTLAAKERYAPWSGAPMAGRMDLEWNGRKITIERSTRGRLIFGDFRAYETQTGIDIPELNATNCGAMLLGVERGVFTQAGFLKLSDLPVVQNDALRRRLNALVTTGDESGNGEKLGKQLKELKNKCRYNRTGLLPQAEAEQEQLLGQLNELQELSEQQEKIHNRQRELETAIAELENHKIALEYAESVELREKVAAAKSAKQAAEEELARQTESCAQLPKKETLAQKQQAARELQTQWMALQARNIPAAPAAPEMPAAYRDLSPEEIRAKARENFDLQAAVERRRKKQSSVMTAVGIAVLAVLAGLIAAKVLADLDTLWLAVAGAAALIISIATLACGAVRAKKFRMELDVLYDLHPGISPDKWIADAEEKAARLEQYRTAASEYEAAFNLQDEQRKALEEKTAELTGGRDLGACLTLWQQQMDQWDALEQAKRELSQQEAILNAFASVVKDADKPAAPDALTHTEAETDSLLAAYRFEQKQLQLKLGQYQGRADALGQESAIRSRLKAVNRKISHLEDTYEALELAQKALSAATTELQRRFAPRISKRAQELFLRLTGGRYQQITLGEDLSLSARTENEDTLRSSQWRSDGTVDQLYLALRLAVAEELTPDAPLVLDDALVRFDDKRLAVALDILKEAAENKQVIVFTCQSRERKL